MIIGVTGKYCAGKNTVAKILQSYGFPEVDVDAVGHDVLEREKHKVMAEFGRSILDDRGTIDRRKLGAMVFACKKNMIRLETILHPPMKDRVRRMVNTHKHGCVINAALLFKMDLYSLCDCVIMVKAPFFTRLLRALRRDRLGLWQALQRFFTQGQIFPKLKRPGVDIYYEYNNGSIDRLKPRIAGLLRQRNWSEG